VLKNKIFLLLAFIWVAIITYLSLASKINLGAEFNIPNKDKMVHFVFYFLFVMLWSKAINNNSYNYKKAIQILIAAIVYGIFMEICQKLFTTTRTADVLDVVANSIGATFGFYFIKYYANKTNQKTSL
jgi:VanZ family protein